MPDRPDLRDLAKSLRESLDGLSRDALVDVLTYVLNEYVVEGPPPLAPAQVERLEDLASLDLAGLVAALQTRLDTPGLELLKVEAGEVRVQTPSGLVTLRPGRSGSSPMSEVPAPAAAQPAHIASRPAPAPGDYGPGAPESSRSTAEEAALRGRGDLSGGQVGVVTAPAPRPRGLSISGRPSAQGGPAAPAAEAPRTPPPAANGPASAATAEAPKGESDGKPATGGERKEDDASIRFSLLELD